MPPFPPISRSPTPPPPLLVLAARLPAIFLAMILSLAAPSAPAQILAPTPVRPLTPLTEAGQLERGGHYAEALAKVDAVIKEQPDEARPRFLKGIILMDLNRVDEAIAVFQKLTDDFPELPEPYNNLAVLYMRQGRINEARDTLERAVEAHPGYATAHGNLGDVYARMAAVEYDKAARIEPANAAMQKKLQAARALIADGAAALPLAGAKPPAPAKPLAAAKPQDAAKPAGGKTAAPQPTAANAAAH